VCRDFAVVFIFIYIYLVATCGPCVPLSNSNSSLGWYTQNPNSLAAQLNSQRIVSNYRMLESKAEAIILTCLLNIAISSLNDSDEQTSPPCTPGSLGVHVANSHFSKISAKSGNSGCLQRKMAWLVHNTSVGQISGHFLSYKMQMSSCLSILKSSNW